VCKGELVNVYRVLVWKDMWCVRVELVNVYRVLLRKGMWCVRGSGRMFTVCWYGKGCGV
jgi:hypothetical protein